MTDKDFDAIMDNIIESNSEYYSAAISAFGIDLNEYWKSVAVSSAVYYISYSVSAVAALNIYSMVLEDEEAAYAAYQALVETPGIEEMGYVEALTAAGIASPFDESSHKKVAKLINDLTK
jgi:oligoendopeptidase F